MGRKHKKKQESKRPVEAENNSEYAPSMAEEPSVSEPTAVAPPSLESSPEVGAYAAPAKRSSIRNSLSSVFRRLSAGNVARNETEGAPLLSSSVGAEEETSAETGPCITETISNTAESYAEKVDSDSNEIEDNNSTLPPTKRSSIRNSFSKLVRRLSGDGGVGEDSAPLLSSLGVSERNGFLDEEKKDLEADRIHLKGGQNHAEDLEDNRSNIKKGVTFSADIEDAYFPPPSNRSSLRSSGDNWRIHTSVTKSEDQWAMEGDEDIIALAPLNEKEEKENDSKLLGRAQRYEEAMKKLQEKPELVDDIRFGKHQFRRASLLPAHDLDLYPPTEPDCGKIGHRPHLSRVHAKEVTQQFKLGYYEAGERKPYPMSCSFGWHRWPNAKYEETDIGMLSEYGVGVAFYFKLVKALLVIFLLMNVCTLPSMIMYILGNYVQPVELAYQKATSSQSFLGSSTIGSLGEPFPICFQVPENQAVTLTCPSNSIIRSVIAYYGQPSGSCTCPLLQQPSKGPTPQCKGKRSFTTSASIFSNKMTFQGQQCVANEDGSLPQCFLGSTRFGVGCCSDSLDDSFHADLSSLNINPVDQCNSYTAQYMADIACRGRNSCTLPIKRNATMSIPLDQLHMVSNVEPESICRTVTGTECQTDLGFRGSFDQCNTDQEMYMLFEAFCVYESHVLLHYKYISSIANQEIGIDNIIFSASILDGLSILIFIFGIFWIGREQRYEEKEYNMLTTRASQYTLECHTIPKHSKGGPAALREKLRTHFETVLSQQPYISSDEKIHIADINFATGHYEYIRAACDRGKLAAGMDRLIGKFTSRLRLGTFNFTSWSSISLLNQVKKLMYKFEIANAKCERLQERASREILKAFITFETEEGYLRCIKTYPDGGRFSSWFQNENTRLEGKVVTIKKAQDPTDIIWENSGFPVVARFFRVLFTTFVTLGLLAVSYVMIFEARYLTTLYVPVQYPIHCEAYKPLVDYSLDRLGPNFSLNRPQNTSSNTILYQDVLLDYNADYYNQTLYGAQGYLRCYCQQINFDKGLQYMQHGYFFYDAKTRTSQTWCSSLQDNSVEGTAVSYLAAFIIVGINLMLSLLLRRLVNFEKWNSYTNQIISLSVKLFFAQYINTGLLSLIIYGDLTRTGGSGINFGAGTEFRFGIFTGDSQDFDVIWYFSIGASLIFTMCLYVFGSIAADLVYIYANYFKRVWDKRTGKLSPLFDERITHCDVQTELDMLYVGIDFPLEYIFANTMTMIFVNMTYSSCMPAMNVVVLFSLSIQYLCTKLLLLRFFRAPPAFSGDLPKTMTRLMYFAAIGHCLIGVWMFGNSPDFGDAVKFIENVFRNDMMTFFYGYYHGWNLPIQIEDRAFGPKSILLLAIAMLVVLFLFARSVSYFLYDTSGIRVMVHSVLHYFDFKATLFELVPDNNPNYFDSLPQTLLQWRVDSNIMSGLLLTKYKQLLSGLKNGATSLPPKIMSGLESYNICYSPEYSIKFGLDTNFLWRYAPTDWLVPANADVLHSSAPQVRKSLVGVMTRNESTRRIFEDGKYEQEIDQFLRYCAPMISVSKRGLREIHMRNTNWLYRSNFNNNLQEGQRRFRGGSVSENHARGSVSWSSAKFSAILAGSRQKVIEDYYKNNKKVEEPVAVPPSSPHKLAAKGGRRSPNNSPNSSPRNSVRKLNI